MFDRRREFTIHLRNSRPPVGGSHRTPPTLLAIVLADDLADAQDEADQLVHSLNGQVAVVSIERGSACGR
jgi:hypothetical protein